MNRTIIRPRKKNFRICIWSPVVQRHRASLYRHWVINISTLVSNCWDFYQRGKCILKVWYTDMWPWNSLTFKQMHWVRRSLIYFIFGDAVVDSWLVWVHRVVLMFGHKFILLLTLYLLVPRVVGDRGIAATAAAQRHRAPPLTLLLLCGSRDVCVFRSIWAGETEAGQHYCLKLNFTIAASVWRMSNFSLGVQKEWHCSKAINRNML